MSGSFRSTPPIALRSSDDVDRLTRFFSTWRLRTYTRLLLVPLFLPLAVVILTADGASTITGRLGGDFPAFYSAGLIVEQGNVEAVYDLESLTAAQEGIKPAAEETFRFAYPPVVAHAYSFLAKMPYREAYALHTAFMFLCLAASVAMLSRLLPTVERWRLEAFICAATFYPLYRAITGGQNSALTLLVLVSVYWALDDDRPVVAGALAGLLLFKPQFAIPVIGLLLVRDWKSGLGFAASAGAIWSWGTAVFGSNWVQWWIQSMTGVWGTSLVTGDAATTERTCVGCPSFNDGDPIANAANSVNIIGFTERFLGIGSVATYLVGGTVCVLLIGGLIWVWRTPDVALDLKVALLACGAILIPPHVMFYDAGILVLPLAILANRLGKPVVSRLVLITALGLVAGFALQLGANALFPATVLILWWSTAELRRDRDQTGAVVAAANGLLLRPEVSSHTSGDRQAPPAES